MKLVRVSLLQLLESPLYPHPPPLLILRPIPVYSFDVLQVQHFQISLVTQGLQIVQRKVIAFRPILLHVEIVRQPLSSCRPQLELRFIVASIISEEKDASWFQRGRYVSHGPGHVGWMDGRQAEQEGANVSGPLHGWGVVRRGNVPNVGSSPGPQESLISSQQVNRDRGEIEAPDVPVRFGLHQGQDVVPHAGSNFYERAVLCGTKISRKLSLQVMAIVVKFGLVA